LHIALFSHRLVYVFIVSLLIPVAQATDDTSVLAISKRVGQKVILDFRYFCDDGTSSKSCRSPVTALPDSLKTVLTSHNIGGVILFSENIQNNDQLISLNHTMQQAMAAAKLPPLFIAIDQEGGRVARLPPSMLTAFPGNLAIGASFFQHGTAFAENVAEGIGGGLIPLGINTNFAPSLDINSERKNPVINVRSFGENPEQVAALGQAFVKGLQSQGVISAVKHFPGHGNTHIDSHSGLPRVEYNKQQAFRGDLLPFNNVINSESPPAMLMSAHIQYPSLDSTLIKDKTNVARGIPATLSRKILHDLLRTELGYKGVVVTDALDMAGISNYFSPEEAMLLAFQAGADIALMPFSIRTPKDIQRFATLMEKVSTAIASNEGASRELHNSYQRISDLKKSFKLNAYGEKTLSWWRGEVANPQRGMRNKQIEKALSQSAVTILYGKSRLPLSGKRWLALMPDAARCLAFEQSVRGVTAEQQAACIPLTVLPAMSVVKNALRDADALIVGDISPRHANYEMGGLDSAEALAKRVSLETTHDFMRQTMAEAKQKSLSVVFVALRMPYVAQDMENYSDVALATFSYNIDSSEISFKSGLQANGPKVASAVFDALVETLIGNNAPNEYVPVQWRTKESKTAVSKGVITDVSH